MSNQTEPSLRFADTRWSRVKAAADSSPQGRAALEELCTRYWTPLYAYLRQRGYAEPDAKDLLQGFIARFLSRNDFGRAEPSKGRFRSYLLSALENYLISQARHDNARMRGGGQIHIPWDGVDAEALCSHEVPPDLSAQERFDRQWVVAILDRAAERLRQEQGEAGLTDQFDQLFPWLTSPPNDGAYAALADRLGKSKAAVTMAVKRLRERFRELVRAEVRDTCRTPGDFQREWAALMSTL